MLIDAAEQSSAFGIQGFQPGVLLPQLLGFYLDQLRSLFDPLDGLRPPMNLLVVSWDLL